MSAIIVADATRLSAVPTAHTEFRCHVDRSGRQHFNFAQRVWLRRSVRMACTRAHSTALATLAVNLLAMVLEEPDRRAAIRSARRRAMSLARRFAEDCLLTAPEDGWVMPRDTIEAWIRTQSGSRARSSVVQHDSLQGFNGAGSGTALRKGRASRRGLAPRPRAGDTRVFGPSPIGGTAKPKPTISCESPRIIASG